jgi:hypothetical protein
MFKLAEPYKPRPIRFLELWEESGWRMKVYGIAYNRSLPRHELIEAAKSAARECLPQPAIFAAATEYQGLKFNYIELPSGRSQYPDGF